MESGLVFNIQRYSVQDGPGIRTTVFLKGCPLGCLWCHNPESHLARSEVTVLESRCLRCGACAEACPRGRREADAVALEQPCTLCGRCVHACPTGARQMLGRNITVDDLLGELLKDRIFYEDSRGGVTFSGGEPLAQLKFLQACLKACRLRGIHTAVDTCGFASQQNLREVAAATDLFLYDVKLIDDQRHQAYTGVSNRLILENLRMLSTIHGNIWVRVPIIPGINDDLAEVVAIAALVKELPGIRRVNLLPYHRTGIRKFDQLGRPYELAGVSPPSPDHLAVLAEAFMAAGIATKIGG